MPIAAVTGASSPIGSRLLASLLAREEVSSVIAVDAGPSGGDGNVDLSREDLKQALQGAEVVVHVAWDPGDPIDQDGVVGRSNLETLARVLEAGAAVGAKRFVLLSSAAVYGAWPDNAVPMPESASIRPNPGAAYAEALAAAERMVAEWRDDHPGASVCLARAALPVGAAPETWMTNKLGGLMAVRVRGLSRPIQFVHVDDLASALALLAVSSIDGPVNVAPDGWMTADTARALATGPVHIGLPRKLALALLGLPAAYVPLLAEPWVVASDRLHALGWTPEHSNEEALVAGRPPTPWQKVSPRRRQELALAGAAVGLAGLIAGIVALVRRSRR